MVEIFNYSNYSLFLKDTLGYFQKNNKSFSLRAMALKLGISHSTLSDVIKEKKNFSEEMAEEVSKRLNLGTKRAKYFYTLVKYKTSKNSDFKLLLANQLKVLNPSLREHFEIEKDKFQLISDWYHSAILEMTYLNGQKLTPKTIATRLGITVDQAANAINLLLRLNLIEVTSDGSLKKTKEQIKFSSQDQLNLALQKFYIQILNKAEVSLREQRPEERVIGGETFPIGLEDFAEASEIIELCFQQILSLSKRSKNRTHVCHLGIQMFKLTKDLDK